MADDVAGVAGGAFSALAGLRREMEQLVRSATDEMAQRLDLVRREEVEVLQEMVLKARGENEALAARLAALEERLAALEQGQAAEQPARKPAAAKGSGQKPSGA
jgi:BMFP domain-containing protein YqiC